MKPMSDEEMRIRLDSLSQSRLQMTEPVLCALIAVCARAWDSVDAHDTETTHRLEIIDGWLGIDTSTFSR